MTPSSFHKFPELPPEIQLQIWESSFRSPKAIPGGLHYICMDHDGCIVALDKTEKDEFQRPRSGYEVEQGLWTACWDSRAAAMKHQLQQNVEFSYPVFRLLSLDFVLGASERYHGAGREPISVTTLIDAGQEHKMDICPSRDIFCVALNRAGRAACSGHFYPLREFKRLAFEFKPPWNTQLSQHDSYYPIKKFKPSLAFVLRLVFEAAHIRHLTTPTIRLIDRNARWINDNTTQLGLDTFYDCDHEYVEISMKPGSSSEHIVCHSPVLEFLDHLDRLLVDKLRNVGFFSRGNGPKFIIRDYFSIIVLRQNQAGAAKE